MNWLARRKRRFDRWVYRRLHALYRAAFPATVAAGPLPAAAVRRVLIARTERVGDMVVLSPALEYLRHTAPAAAIDVIASRTSATLLAGDARVRDVYVYRRGLLGWLRAVHTLRARRYDVVFTLRLRDHLDEGLFAALIAGRTGARITARRPTQYVGLFTHSARVPHSRRHIVERLLHVVRAGIVGTKAVHGPNDGALASHSQIRDTAEVPMPWAREPRVDHPHRPAPLVVDASAERRADALVASWGGRPFVAFNAWGSDPRRCFGIERAAEIAALITARHRDLVVVLTPPPAVAREAAAIARIVADVSTATAPRVVVAPPSANLHDLVSLLRRAAVVISPDTANVHIASALGTPVVAVYTDVTDAAIWGPWGATTRAIHLAPGERTPDVQAEVVANAFDELWLPMRRDEGRPIDHIA